MALFSAAHVRTDAFDLARAATAKTGSSKRRRVALRHSAEMPKGSDAFADAEFSNEKPLMLRLSLVAFALIGAGLALLALG